MSECRGGLQVLVEMCKPKCLRRTHQSKKRSQRKTMLSSMLKQHQQNQQKRKDIQGIVIKYFVGDNMAEVTAAYLVIDFLCTYSNLT